MGESFEESLPTYNILISLNVSRFEQPPAIHQRAIVPLVKGCDAIVQTSGLEKTVLLVISAIQKVNSSVKGAQALILTPTRELAMAIQNVVKALGTNLNIDGQTCNAGDDPGKLQNAQVIIGTPGRVYDVVKRRVLSPEKIRLLCIDEADEIMARGFRDHLHDVFHLLPQDIQIVLSSRTLPADVLEVEQKFMHDPIRIVKKDGPSLDNVKQYYIAIEREEWKLDTVLDLFENLATPQHADMEQKLREALMKGFRDGDSRILITTDILARGLDVRGMNLSPVINYDLPANKENYIHRITRGTLGQSAIAINFVTPDDVRTLRDIEQFYNTQIDEMPLNVADLL
ncbi:hypothetical protein C0991_002551 [Blastosporella zonata]|nr:hypothetical protein C0991_002551 [Blastosporella zonata]